MHNERGSLDSWQLANTEKNYMTLQTNIPGHREWTNRIRRVTARGLINRFPNILLDAALPSRDVLGLCEGSLSALNGVGVREFSAP
jgi:hypothetical protein